MAATIDWVSLVEATYRLDGDCERWLTRLATAAAAKLGEGAGCLAYTFEVATTGVVVHDAAAAAGAAPAILHQARDMVAVTPPAATRLIYEMGARVGSTYQLLQAADPREAEAFQGLMSAGSGGRYRDAVGVVAHDAEQHGVVITAPRLSVGGLRRESSWSMVASHIGASYRLRRKLVSLGLDDASVEAVLEPDGRVTHSTEAACDALNALKGAVRDIDRARGSLRRRDSEEALRLWRALVNGRWSLLDYLDTDGRRFLVARRNDPKVRDPRGLTAREQIVAELVGRGQTLKEIAYELGVSRSAVGKVAARARHKLGLNSLAELALFFGINGLRHRLQLAHIAGEALAFAELAVPAGALDGLTNAELHVSMELLRGSTTRAIARGRGTSESTVANQIASVFRKLGVSSRAELASCVGGVRAPS